MNKCNYMYDIYLNLNKKLYDFFDWNKSDKIIHIKKIPIIKTSEENISILIQNKININRNTLLQIYNKTEIYNKVNKIDYCALFSSDTDVISIQFDDKGNSIKKSNLLLNDELDTIEIINDILPQNIEFKIIKKEKKSLQTRKQLKEENFINSELKNIDDKKLSYIYLECFGKRESNRKLIIEKIRKEKKNIKIYKTIYNILKLTTTSKK